MDAPAETANAAASPPPALCSFCGQPARSPRQRTCRACHAKSAKAYRARRRAEIAAALGLATAEDFTANG